MKAGTHGCPLKDPETNKGSAPGRTPFLQALARRSRWLTFVGVFNLPEEGMAPMQAVLVYVTVGSHDEALTIARTAVAERLAACANILGEITSVFRWEGKVEEDGEVSLILKTRADFADALTERVLELHSYDCPCVVAIPVTAGNPAFLQWIGEETAAN